MAFVSLCKNAAKRLGEAILIAAISLLLLEAALWVLSATNKTFYYMTASGVTGDLSDPVLEVRLDPNYPGHDSAGYRNAVALDRADLVALGDSMTYGFGVNLQDAWPQQIGHMSGMQVYNMAVPGYGPVQSLALTPRALKLQPRWIASAFYDGNDLYDAFHMVYTRNLMTGLRSTDPAVMAEIDRAQSAESLETISYKLFKSYQGEFGVVAGTWGQTPSLRSRAVFFFKAHCKVWNAGRTARRAILERGASSNGSLLGGFIWDSLKKKSQRSAGSWLPFERGDMRTIFMPNYRTTALRLDDPRLREGLRISVEAMRQMAAEARAGNAELLVVMIPTKELVFYDAIASPGDPTMQALSDLAQKETAMRASFKEEVCGEEIRCVDVLPALCDSVRAGVSPFPMDVDGHPNRLGHRLIAETVYRSISNAAGSKP
jgi:lysophospholipase L1-like esterase